MPDLRRPSRRPQVRFRSNTRGSQLAANPPVEPKASYVRSPRARRRRLVVVVASLLSTPGGCTNRYSEAEPAQAPQSSLTSRALSAAETSPTEKSGVAPAPAQPGFAEQLELAPAPQPADTPVVWAVTFEQPSARAFETPEQALAAPVRLRGAQPSMAETELRLKVDDYRSWSLRELERRGLPPERWTLSMLVDELHGLQPGPHRLSVFATTQSGAVVRHPELALTSQRFTVGEAPAADVRTVSDQPDDATPAAFWFGPEGTLNGAAAREALLQFHVSGRERVWLQVTAPDASRAVHELTGPSYVVSGWVSGDYHFALLEAAQGPALVEQVVTVNLDLPASEAGEGAW